MSCHVFPVGNMPLSSLFKSVLLNLGIYRLYGHGSDQNVCLLMLYLGVIQIFWRRSITLVKYSQLATDFGSSGSVFCQVQSCPPSSKTQCLKKRKNCFN